MEKKKLKYKKFQIIFDPIFKNKLINLLINKSIKNGKKSKAFKFIYLFIKILEKKTNKKSIHIFYKYFYKNEFLFRMKILSNKFYEIKLKIRIQKIFNILLKSIKNKKIIFLFK